MVFSSIVFLFYFLPVVLTSYLVLFHATRLFARPLSLRVSNFLLLCSSLAFYFWGETWLIGAMLASTALDFVCGRLMGDVDPDEPRALRHKLVLATSITGNLALLAFFKYSGFAVENAVALSTALGLEVSSAHSVWQVALPLGISFYTFQSMSYTIDVYRGRVRPTRNLLDFACYVTMFPQLVAGPIVRYAHIAEQLVDRAVTSVDLTVGIRRFAIGLAKKVLVANTVGLVADRIFGLPVGELTATTAWLGVTCYGLQIYFDFSGYSDMAIGLGRMFGFNFDENFHYPYIADSIREFWRRWHISLSTWFRDYLYIPLGGNRVSPRRTAFNLLAVFFLCGLWHGASWTFVIWGMFHGVFLAAERLGLGRWLERRPPALRHAYTLLVVLAGWVFFRSETIGGAFGYLAAMAGFGHGSASRSGADLYLDVESVAAIAIGIVGSTPIIPALRERCSSAPSGLRKTLNLAVPMALLGLLGLSTLALSSGTHNPFIYFRF